MYRMAAMSTVVMMITTPMTMVMTMTMMMIMTNVEKLLSHRHQSTAATVHVYIHGSRYCSNGACLFLFCFLCFFSFSSSSVPSVAALDELTQPLQFVLVLLHHNLHNVADGHHPAHLLALTHGNVANVVLCPSNYHNHHCHNCHRHHHYF
eukprot:TRINITY_DN227_c0_g1_i10.p1 TRINITY_DN227_c0_g1~~TRINITY_DN227_c0_g1_i10.p1  ORF type:complete len:150 (-),score=29.02 TRINITY_DN227_c0_g1_i10:45-494(-)